MSKQFCSIPAWDSSLDGIEMDVLLAEDNGMEQAIYDRPEWRKRAMPPLHKRRPKAVGSSRLGKGVLPLPRVLEDIHQPVIIGRFFCERCEVVATVVMNADVEEVRCPRCNGLALSACGDEA